MPKLSNFIYIRQTLEVFGLLMLGCYGAIYKGETIYSFLGDETILIEPKRNRTETACHSAHDVNKASCWKDDICYAMNLAEFIETKVKKPVTCFLKTKVELPTESKLAVKPVIRIIINNINYIWLSHDSTTNLSLPNSYRILTIKNLIFLIENVYAWLTI